MSERESEPGPRSLGAGPVRLPRRLGPQSTVETASAASAGRPAAMAAGVPDPVRLLSNVDLHAAGLQDPGYKTGSGWETTAAEGGGVIFYTGNWFAAFSLDRARTWTYLDPYKAFPASDGGFAADQIVRYIPQLRVFVWLLQYGNKGEGSENRDRLAFASPQEIIASKGTTWRYWDVTSASLNQTGLWLDFPDLAVGAHDLYLSTNVFHENGKDAKPSLRGALIARYPLSTFRASSSLPRPTAPAFSHRLSGNYYYDAAGSTLRIAQFQPGSNTGERAVFAQHHGSDQLRVYYWDESSRLDPVPRDIDIASVPGAKGEAGTWLKESVDTRILGAAKSGNQAWFAWDAGRADSPDDTDRFKWPHIEIAKITVPGGGNPDLTLDGQLFIRNDEHAFAFPALASNAAGEVGISFEWGAQNANFGVGILTGEEELVDSADGDRLGGGHYQSIVASGSAPDLFVAAGRVELKDPSISVDGYGNHPYYVLFGRTSVRPPLPPTLNPLPPPGPQIRQATSITASCPGSITTGDSATVGGHLAGPPPGTRVVVDFTAPSGGVQVIWSTTDANGDYQASVSAGENGPWQVSARYDGDDAYLDSSAQCGFIVRAPQPGKAPSSISIACPASAFQRTTFQVSGAINPPHPGAPVQVTWTAPGGGPLVHDLTADGQSNYTDSIYAADAGTWHVQAYWPGDADYQDAYSQICEFNAYAIPK